MILNCPYCRGPVIKNFDSGHNIEVNFILRCPHCKKELIIQIKTEIRNLIFIDGEKIKQPDGPGIRLF